MKKFFFPSLLLLAVCLGCNDDKQSGTSDKAKKNIENFDGVTKMFESGDFSKTGDYIAADAVDHAGPTGEIKGVDSIKAMFNVYSGMVSDMKNEYVKQLADDEYVMTWMKQNWTAKTDDPMMQLKAGEKGHMESIEVTKHNADGKITDHWSFISMADMMKAMGPQGNMGVDNTKKDTTKNK